jgi:hypothetical protein
MVDRYRTPEVGQYQDDWANLARIRNAANQ